MIEVLSKRGWLHSALLPSTCIRDVDPRGIEGAVGPGQLCHGHIQQFPWNVEVAEDGTDNADTSKWEQYLQGKRGPSAGDPPPLPALASTASLSCHLSQGVMPHLPLPLQEASQAVLLQHTGSPVLPQRHPCSGSCTRAFRPCVCSRSYPTPHQRARLGGRSLVTVKTADKPQYRECAQGGS